MNDRTTGPNSREVVSWAVAAFLAGAALIGVLALVVVVIFAIGDEVPGWITLLLGGGLALGAAIFAWILAKALRSKQ